MGLFWKEKKLLSYNRRNTVAVIKRNGLGDGAEQLSVLGRVATVRGKHLVNEIFFQGQGKVREFCGWSGKFRKDLESQGKFREFENKWLWQADFRKFIYSVQEGKRCTFMR